jgi:uncharacterized protein YjbI with pentapeptide repeats
MLHIRTQEELSAYLGHTADLSLAKLERVTLDPAAVTSLRDANLVECKMPNGGVMPTELDHALFIDCQMQGAYFIESGLFGARFIRCDLSRAQFHGCDLSAATFVECVWTDAVIEDCEIDAALLPEALIA